MLLVNCLLVPAKVDILCCGFPDAPAVRWAVSRQGAALQSKTAGSWRSCRGAGKFWPGPLCPLRLSLYLGAAEHEGVLALVLCGVRG